MFGIKKKEKSGSADKTDKEDKGLKKSGRVALCLGGGGMRGFAHIGAIKAFRENNIRFDMVCGTSIGSLMGALYALDYPTGEMIEKAGQFKFKKIHNGFPFPSKNPDRILQVVSSIVGDARIEDLRMPYFCMAVNVITGEQVILDEGRLDEAVTCSCNIPILFKPYPLGDKRLCDGGLKNNIPAATARMLGADKVITVDVNPTRGNGTNNLGYISMIMTTLDLAMSNSSTEGLINSDAIIAPDLSRFSSYDENGWSEMIELGYTAAMEQLDNIKRVVGNKKLY